MADVAGPARPSGKAMLSLVLGLASLVCFLITGLPALFFGVLGLREINQSDGRLTGRRAAVIGMVTGGIGCAVGVLSLLVIVFVNLQERGNRVTCQGNLRRLGQAVLVHQQRQQAFPTGTLPNDALTPARRLSWQANMLEYPSLGHEAIFIELDLRKAWDDPANRQAVGKRVRWYLCPSHRQEAEPDSPALTHYVGFAGVGADAATLPKGDPRAGIFGYDRHVTLTDLTAGASYTMLATETNADNGPWAAGGPATVRGLDPGQRPYLGKGRPFGGLHPDGLNVLFADGAVRFINDDLPAEFFETQVRIHRDD